MELKNISLLHLMKTFDIGGVEKSTINYSNQISNRIKKVNILAFKGSFDYKNIITPKVKTYFFPYIINHNPITFFMNARVFINVLKKQKINYIHYHQRIFIIYILLVKLFYTKIKIIYTGHNVFNDFINKLLIADRFIAVSLAVKKDLVKANKKNVHLIYHGIYKETKEEIKDIHKTPLNFGYVGRFIKIKGILTLLKAFKLFQEKYSQYKLIFNRVW